MNATASRKRGRSPATQANPLQGTQPTYPTPLGVEDPSQLSNDQFMAWGTTADAPTYHINPTSFSANQGVALGQEGNVQPTEASPSSQLVRRNLNRELTVLGGREVASGQDAWQDPVDGVVNTWEEFEDGDDLDAKAAVAKREAQSRRPPKQIPPFIQKLSSFLDSSRNTDLIRWSDDGNSFIVLDEERFANELIPELFKHKNYASFVRQLNMYGFHKRVGLADNSMRASERKARSPSEYINPFFKRGRPELLWLIQKPQAPITKKGTGRTKGDGQGQDSEEDDHIGSMERTSDGLLQQKPNMDLSTVSQPAFNNLQKEVAELQKSQQQIAGILTRLRVENNQYIRQASTMVAQHERHENSINAILTFLATFYSRSQESQSNLPNMFGSSFPNNNQFQNNQHQGNVVDVGDFDDNTFNSNNNQFQMPRQGRRPLALLPAPSTDGQPLQLPSHQGSSTASGQDQRLQVPKQRNPLQRNSNLRNSPLSATSSPPSTIPSPATTATNHKPSVSDQSDDIMSVIHNANLNAQHNRTASAADSVSPNFDFDSALQHYQHADGQAPLTDEQRNSMLNLMANNSGTVTPSVFGGTGIGGSNPFQSPLDYFNSNRDQLDILARMQDEQDSKMQHLADRLQPLSPSGSIPGFAFSPSSAGALSPLGGAGEHAQNDGDDFDINAFINDLSAEAAEAAANNPNTTDAPNAHSHKSVGHQNGNPNDDMNGYFPRLSNTHENDTLDFGSLADPGNPYDFAPTPPSTTTTTTTTTSAGALDDPNAKEDAQADTDSLFSDSPGSAAAAVTAQPQFPSQVAVLAPSDPLRRVSGESAKFGGAGNSAVGSPSVESASESEGEGVGGGGSRKRRRVGA